MGIFIFYSRITPTAEGVLLHYHISLSSLSGSRGIEIKNPKVHKSRYFYELLAGSLRLTLHQAPAPSPCPGLSPSPSPSPQAAPFLAMSE